MAIRDNAVEVNKKGRMDGVRSEGRKGAGHQVQGSGSCKPLSRFTLSAI